jgi:hypothetical protein
MNKTFKIYAVIFIIVMTILALLEVNKKETQTGGRILIFMKNLLLACLFLIMKLEISLRII